MTVSAIRRAASRYGIVGALALMILIAALQSNFLTSGNLANVSDQWTPVAVMAIGMTFCLIGGGFDLSVGATYALTATVSASLAQSHGAPTVIVATLALGAAIGVANGVLVTVFGINPLIATLGSSQVIGGAALLCSNGQTYSVTNDVFLTLGSGRIGSLPVSVLVLAGVAALGGLLLATTTYGHGLYATGGNAVASYVSGIRTDRTRMLTYVVTGGTAALAGMLYIGRVGSGQANIGTGIQLQVIAAALIGGVSLLGGEGRIWQALTGVAILAVLQNFFNQASINAYWQSIVQGLVIIVAVGFDAFSRGESLTAVRHRLARWRVRQSAPLEVGEHAQMAR